MPMTQTLLLRVFPPDKRNAAMGMWAMTLMLGPAMGPIIGGYISDVFSWHWIFLLNIPIAIACTIAGHLLLRPVETPTKQVPIDKIGLALLVFWVGCLQVMLDLGRDRDWFSDPLIVATYPIPKSSLLPLILLIFGLGEMSKVVMVAIGVFYPMAINATAGVLQINQIYLDVGKSFKASPWDTFRTIALPGALPFIMTGVKLGAGLALILIAIAEMVGAKSGIGFMIWSAWETFAVAKMYVGLFVIALIGFAISLLLNEIERWVIRWKADA